MLDAVVVESPVQPQKFVPLGTAVSCTARPSGTKSPERLMAVSALTEPPVVGVAASLNWRASVAVSVSPASWPLIGWLMGPPSDQLSKNHRVRPSGDTWPPVKLT